MLQEYVKATNKSFELTLSDLKDRLAERKFGVLAAISLSDKFKDKGIEYLGQLTILEVCNPFEAAAALAINPAAAYFLPCKILVREVNGCALIEMAKPSSLIEILHEPKLVDFARKIEDLLIEAADAV